MKTSRTSFTLLLWLGLGLDTCSAWFVIDALTKTENGFASEEEFNVYIKGEKYPSPH